MFLLINRTVCLFFVTLFLLINHAWGKTIRVGPTETYTTINAALRAAQDGDTVMVAKGHYQEGNIVIDKSIYFIGIDTPVLDGGKNVEILSVAANGVTVKGFRIQRSGQATLNDPAGIKVYDSEHVTIEGNYLYDNFFGIYMQYSRHCIIKDNVLIALAKEEYQSGNGIHCWKSNNLQVTGNRIVGHRDGIYFEFVTHSVIWRNVIQQNLRYGLHFMFSHNDAYFTNYFKKNGAGVAVMYTKNVVMMNNTFEDSWGDAAYGILLKDISDCYMAGNHFVNNTTGIFMDGSNRMRIEKKSLRGNGWALRIQANCMDNVVTRNNFQGNTFDVSTNGSLTLNVFDGNYWDKYEGYDLDKDKKGDVPYHPLSLFSMIVEQNPPAMLLFRSFMIGLLDKSERMLPSLTPENFVDKNPLMTPLAL